MSIYSIILLAAGPSQRMGTPKQLLLYKKSLLLQHVMDQANASIANKTIVVLGAFEQEVKDNINKGEAHFVINNDWKEGLASSIRCGINEVQKRNPATDAAILLACDQPFVSAELINKLVRVYEKTGKPIVSSAYNSQVVTPVLFHQSIFPELLLLTGDNGPESVIEIHQGNTTTVPFQLGAIDINTTEDYKALPGV